jgi:hypothetical protein
MVQGIIKFGEWFKDHKEKYVIIEVKLESFFTIKSIMNSTVNFNLQRS